MAKEENNQQRRRPLVTTDPFRFYLGLGLLVALFVVNVLWFREMSPLLYGIPGALMGIDPTRFGKGGDKK